MTRTGAGLALVEREEAHGRVRLSLVDHANGFSRAASTLTIDRLDLHDGAGGRVRVAGIGNVATLESYRGRGLASVLLEEAIERMRAGDAAGVLLYGIDGFYEPLGWRSCGDERWVAFGIARERSEPAASPSGTHARVRTMTEGDRLSVAELYERIAASVAGAAARPADGRAWALLDPSDVAVVERDGELVGWAWRGAGSSARTNIQRDMPGMAAFVELQSIDMDAAWHVVQAARDMVSASEESPLSRIVTGAPDAHPLRELVRFEWLDAQLVDVERPHGGAMLLTLTDDAVPLRRGTYQFMPDRF